MRKALWYSIFSVCIILSACRNRSHTNAYIVPNKDSIVDNHVKSPNPPNDLQVIINEEMLNKAFKALGPIQGKEPYQVLFVRDSFTWVLVNPQLHLHTGKADFTTDVNVITKGLMYSTPCTGNVGIWYDRTKNLINVKIMTCMVEIYTKVMGTKYHLKDLDLADHFTEPFTFAGPTSTTSDMDMEMPDGTIRKLYMITTDCDLSVQEKQIVVPCELSFSLTPPPNPMAAPTGRLVPKK